LRGSFDLTFGIVRSPQKFIYLCRLGEKSIRILLLLKGLIIGFSIAAPVGPIGVLCIRRNLAKGRTSGLASGLGAATADAIYGGIAGLGLTRISNLLLEQQAWFRSIGGGFLLYLGIRTFLSKPAGAVAAARRTDLAGDYLSTSLLTLTNPLTILSFAAIFAGLGLAGPGRVLGYAGVLVWGPFFLAQGHGG